MYDKKIFFPKTFLLIACTGLFITGCRKLYDYISSHGDGDFKTCNIKKITYYRIYDDKRTLRDTVTYNFTYNRLGDPISVINNKVETGNPNLFFTYDRYNRLSEYLREYSSSSYDTWSTFYYNDKGQIVYQSVYGNGNIVNGRPQFSDIYASHVAYSYDNKGRIAHEVDSAFFRGTLSGVFPFDYSYDANGDRVGATYDNKLSLYRTNSVWMFITRDYSLHNPFTATRYNDFSLPQTIIDAHLVLLPSAPFTQYNIEYFCQ